MKIKNLLETKDNFTESKETAEYLERELRQIFGDRVISYTGSSTMILKAAIEDSFNPKQKTEIMTSLMYW